MNSSTKLILSLAAALLIPAAANGQAQNNISKDLRCDENRNSDRGRYCEVREQTIAYPGQLTIDGRTNGGVTVKGSDRGDVLVRFKITANAADDAAARALGGQVRVNLAAGRIAADGPSVQDEGGWSVSYEIFTPRQSNLDITAHNGGIAVSDVRGNVQFTTQNGGIRLARVSGNIHGRTTNGGVHIELAGNRWDGQGLDVATTNGGISLDLPAGYSAHLEASTLNGGFKSDYPIDRGNEKRRISADIGAGGATLRTATTNGGIRIRKI